MKALEPSFGDLVEYVPGSNEEYNIALAVDINPCLYLGPYLTINGSRFVLVLTLAEPKHARIFSCLGRPDILNFTARAVFRVIQRAEEALG